MAEWWKVGVWLRATILTAAFLSAVTWLLVRSFNGEWRHAHGVEVSKAASSLNVIFAKLPRSTECDMVCGLIGLAPHREVALRVRLAPGEKDSWSHLAQRAEANVVGDADNGAPAAAVQPHEADALSHYALSGPAFQMREALSRFFSAGASRKSAKN